MKNIFFLMSTISSESVFLNQCSSCYQPWIWSLNFYAAAERNRVSRFFLGSLNSVSHFKRNITKKLALDDF